MANISYITGKRKPKNTYIIRSISRLENIRNKRIKIKSNIAKWIENDYDKMNLDNSEFHYSLYDWQKDFYRGQDGREKEIAKSFGVTEQEFKDMVREIAIGR